MIATRRLVLLALVSVACSSVADSGPAPEGAAPRNTSAASTIEDDARVIDLDAVERASPSTLDDAALFANAAWIAWGVEMPAHADGDLSDADDDWPDVADDAPAAKSYALASDGTILGERRGVFVRAGGHTYRWEVERVSVARMPCAEYDGVVRDDDPDREMVQSLLDEAAREKAELEREPTTLVDRASFVDVETNTRWVVGDLGDHDGLRDVTFHTQLTSTVGSLAFVRTRTTGYACGVHGNTNSDSIVLDLVEKKPADVRLSPAAIARGARAVETTFDAQRAHWGGVRGFDDDGPELVELLPTFDREGALAVRARYVTGAPYAFSSGGWAGYAMATTTPVDELPPALSAHAESAVAVRALLRARPTFTLRGVSAASTD